MRNFLVIFFVCFSLFVSGCIFNSPLPDVCVDGDGDGFGDPASVNCDFSGLDCDDGNNSTFPGATEICGGGVDEDCDSLVDCDDSDCTENELCTGDIICGNNYCESSESCLSCSQDCGTCPITENSSSLFSQAYELTWPPQIYSDGKVGAESNPTGNPLGGFYNYNRIVSPADANYIVHTKDEFLDAINQLEPGQILYIDDNAIIDLTGVWNLEIPGNVTIASGRGRGFSQGALIKNLQEIRLGDPNYRTDGSLFIITGPHTRITGLRIEGGDKETQASRHSAIFYTKPPRSDLSGIYYHIKATHGITVKAPFVEIDNNEIFGWTHGGVDLTKASSNYLSAYNTYVHHNYIHNNVHAGLGYGVVIGYADETHPINALIEANIFNRNRHSVASTFAQHASYEARYNIVGVEDTQHSFDRHGNDGWSGDYTLVHHNTCRYPGESGRCIAISGVNGPRVSDGIQIYNNWFYVQTLEQAVKLSFHGDVFDNFLGFEAPNDKHLPVAKLNMDKDTTTVGAEILFDAKESYVLNDQVSYICLDYGDRTAPDCGLVTETKKHSYSEPGRYLVTLRVVDPKGVYTTTTKSVKVLPSNPDAVVASFWLRDTYHDGFSGYFKKKVLIDDQVVWERDVNADGTEWEHIVIDITPYVKDASEFNFQIETLQDYVAPLYPEVHPFEWFDVFIDDIFISNRDYSVENFGDFEDNSFAHHYLVGVDGTSRRGSGAWYMYKEGDLWWEGYSSYDDRASGEQGFRFDSKYRMNSSAGSVRGLKQMIYAPTSKPLLDIVNSFDTFNDISSYQVPVSFVGLKDDYQNNIVDFTGYSKKFNGNDNYLEVPNFDLSQDWVLNFNVFLPEINQAATLIYANSGSNFVHIYYAPTNKITIKTNSVETTCDVPALWHDGFSNIIVGKSCTDATCALSCGSNGEVNIFTNPNANINLAGNSALYIGGYNGGSNNLFGALHRATILQGPLSNSRFLKESKSALQGAWVFREGTNGIIKDASIYNIDLTIPEGITFGVEDSRNFLQITKSNPVIRMERTNAMKPGKQLSVEFVGRYQDASTEAFIALDGLPYKITNRKPSRMHFALKALDDTRGFGEAPWYGYYGVVNRHILKDNEWYHIVYTKDGDYLRMYVNGVLDGKVYVPEVPFDTNSFRNLSISGSDSVITGNFNGDVQRVSIYDKTISSSEVEALYKSSLLACSDSDKDGYGTFPRSGTINGCRFDGFDCDDNNDAIDIGSGDC